ncbi:hypothetical protein HYN48_08030 [Flavobacterium magnum]|uniref:Leucine-rich repeat domain-containing protein n=1 Tax=Flavobacterium magnum TaxID=2162713 RepID=A0A2S0RFG3_9FLAO|nr:hypothetical protein [Flavobacterium magnum]AWA30030.1 hypothetical protein HYN48_08030 [Flavobacterium magnum]
MSYQSVIRDASGNLVTETPISVRISIVKNDPLGIAVYVETHAVTTNENGLASLEIGGGTPVTGTFSAISWGDGNYFIKTETDPEGGSNYSISGTSQLLSVPYALYSGTSLNQGKSTIFITGDTSNAEAAAQIQSQFGPNTENIIVDATTQLTTLDLSMVTTLLDLQITNNRQLVTLNLSHLTTVYRDVSISDNLHLTTVDFSAFTTSRRKFDVVDNNDLSSLTFPALTKIAPGSKFLLTDNASMTSLSFPVMTASYNLDIEDNPLLQTIDLGALINNTQKIYIANNAVLANVNLDDLHTGRTVTITGNNQIGSLNLPALTSGTLFINSSTLASVNLPLIATGSVSVYGDLISSITLPSLATGGFSAYGDLINSISLPSLTTGSVSVHAPMLTSLEIPLLTVADLIGIQATGFTSLSFEHITSINSLHVSFNTMLTSVTFPALTFLKECSFQSNPVLGTVAFPVLDEVGGIIAPGNYNQYAFSYNALTVATVNNLLHTWLLVAPATGKQLFLGSQSPPAPPTGQGIIDKQALISAGNTVVTD